MKASELVAALQRLIAMHGDLPVVNDLDAAAFQPECVDDEVIVLTFDEFA